MCVNTRTHYFIERPLVSCAGRRRCVGWGGLDFVDIIEINPHADARDWHNEKCASFNTATQCSTTDDDAAASSCTQTANNVLYKAHTHRQEKCGCAPRRKMNGIFMENRRRRRRWWCCTQMRKELCMHVHSAFKKRKHPVKYYGLASSSSSSLATSSSRKRTLRAPQKAPRTGAHFRFGSAMRVDAQTRASTASR